MVDHARDDTGADDETFQEWRSRYIRGHLTFLASMLILLGILALVAPWLPTYSTEQEGADPVLWTIVGVVLVAVGSIWLRQRVKRDGFHPHSS